MKNFSWNIWILNENLFGEHNFVCHKRCTYSLFIFGWENFFLICVSNFSVTCDIGCSLTAEFSRVLLTWVKYVINASIYMQAPTFNKFSGSSGVFERWIAWIILDKNGRLILQKRKRKKKHRFEIILYFFLFESKNTYGKSSGFVLRTLIASSLRLSKMSKPISSFKSYTSTNLVAVLFIFGTSPSNKRSCCSFARSNSSSSLMPLWLSSNFVYHNT